MDIPSPRGFLLEPIAGPVADGLRARGGIQYTADSKPGYPCRQCLRDADVGDELILVSYDPFTQDSPYRSASPIFLHTQPCTPDADGAAVPEQLAIRQLSVRAFDDREMMTDAALIDGHQFEQTIARFLDDDDADHVHVHNATRGCWAVTVRRT